MSRVSEWTLAVVETSMKWNGAAEEEDLQSQSPHCSNENACTEGTFVRQVDALPAASQSVLEVVLPALEVGVISFA